MAYSSAHPCKSSYNTIPLQFLIPVSLLFHFPESPDQEDTHFSSFQRTILEARGTNAKQRNPAVIEELGAGNNSTRNVTMGRVSQVIASVAGKVNVLCLKGHECTEP